MVQLIFIWLWRAWPILITLFFAGIHLAVYTAIPAKSDTVNKFIGTVMQLLGGYIVLYSVNGNLGLLRNQSFASVIVSWLKEFPLIKKSTIISMTAGISVALGGSAAVSAALVATTIEERMAELERRLTEIRNTLTTQDATLRQHIEEIKNELELSIHSNKSTIKKISMQLELATIGGFKLQSFGVLLVIYGAICGFFS